jgi:hypothetical protein
MMRHDHVVGPNACGVAGTGLVSPPFQCGELATLVHVAHQSSPAAPRGPARAKGSWDANMLSGGVIFKYF